MNESLSIIPSLVDISITWKGVKNLIEGLDSGKFPGSDDISPKLLKLIQCEVERLLKFNFKNSLRTSEIADDWKLAKSASVYKKRSKSYPSNYRPVSLTSVSCKLLEDIIKSALYSHLEWYSLIADRQHDFRKNWSCTTQFLTLVNVLF